MSWPAVLAADSCLCVSLVLSQHREGPATSRLRGELRVGGVIRAPGQRDPAPDAKEPSGSVVTLVAVVSSMEVELLYVCVMLCSSVSLSQVTWLHPVDSSPSQRYRQKLSTVLPDASGPHLDRTYSFFVMKESTEIERCVSHSSGGLSGGIATASVRVVQQAGVVLRTR